MNPADNARTPATRGIRAIVFALSLAAFTAALAVIRPPATATGIALYQGDPELTRTRSNAVASAIAAGLARSDFPTTSPRFDGEWLLMTHVMAALGHAQLAMSQASDEELGRAERALGRALDADLRAFDTEAWGTDALEDLGRDRAHAGYLGYVGLALGVVETAELAAHQSARHSELRRAIAEHLFGRYRGSGCGVLETYPGEAYPPDITAALAAIGISFRLDGRAGASTLFERFFARYRDHDTGLLVQAVDPRTCDPTDRGRGSGTAFASYLASFASERISRELYRAAKRALYVEAGGFGAMREYPGSGAGDIDSGPVLCGLGVSATGFALGAARANGDREVFTRLYATAHFAGLPLCRDDRCGYLAGGALGDAILFAMVTAIPPDSRPAVLNASLESGG